MRTLPDTILDTALPAIAFDGWTIGVLETAARQAGFDAFAVRRAFPNGPIDAVNHFMARINTQMPEQLPPDFSALKIRERIARAVMTRLRIMQPHREAVRRAMALYAMPWHARDGLKHGYAIADTIWRAAGDTSTDYNFYTKRLILAKVYAATLTVWLNDGSAELTDTEAFLRRRIENVMQFEKFKAGLKNRLGGLQQWMPTKRRA